MPEMTAKFKCPECEHSGGVYVYATVVVHIGADGISIDPAEGRYADYDRKSVAVCPECGHEARLDYFDTEEDSNV